LFNKTLVVVAHPDDEVLGCGGVIARFSKGDNFRVVFIAEGSTCRFSKVDSPEARLAITQRTDSAIKAMNSLSVKQVYFHDLPCGQLDTVPILSINKIIEKHIEEFLPETLITHSSKDANSDHRRVAEAALMATRPGALNRVSNLLSAEIPSSSEWSFVEVFTPNVFVPLSKEQVEAKSHALMMYESEVRDYPFPRSERGLMTLAQYRGMQSANEYAEAFTLVRAIDTLNG